MCVSQDTQNGKIKLGELNTQNTQINLNKQKLGEP